MVEAVETLGRIPMTVRPRGHANAMPASAPAPLSLLEMIEAEESGERLRAEAERNRVRLPAKARDISRMDEALNWPLQYLDDYPEIAKAVGLAALWTAQKADIRKRCKARGISPKTFHRRQIHGLTIIAQELTRAKVPVT